MSENIFNHIMNAQVALSKAHMAYLDADHLNMPDLSAVRAWLGSAEAEIAKAFSNLPGFPDD